MLKRLPIDSRHTLTACESCDGKEVKDVCVRPGARVGVGSARQRPLAAHGVGCPAASQNLETWQLSRHYIAEISLNVTLNHNQPTKYCQSEGFDWHTCVIHCLIRQIFQNRPKGLSKYLCPHISTIQWVCAII